MVTEWEFSQGLICVRIREPMNFSVLESGILGFGVRNPALGILRPANDWNPESRSLKIHCRRYYATKREAIDWHEGNHLSQASRRKRPERHDMITANREAPY